MGRPLSGELFSQPLAKSFDQIGREKYGESWSLDTIVDELSKAVATTTGIGSDGSLNTLLLENLDATMTSVLFQKRHLKLFNAIPRVPAAQTLYQWTRQLSYGTGRGSLGFTEGGSPATFVPSFMRGNATVRFYGVRRGYTHQLLQVGMMGGSFIDPAAEENRSGTLDLLQKIEVGIPFGSAAQLHSNGASGVHYDGLFNQIQTNYPQHVIDLAGAPLTFENLENFAEDLVVTGQLLDFSNLRCFMQPRVAADLAKFNLQNQRFWMGTENMANGWRPGLPMNGYSTQFGNIPFETSIFMDPVPNGKVNYNVSPSTGLYTVVSDPSAPSKPGTVSLTALSAPGSIPSGYSTSPTGAAANPPYPAASTIPAGTWYYFVSAFNENGESDVLTIGSALSVAVTAGQAVEVQITGTTNSTGYRIYRGLSSDPLDATNPAYWIATAYPATVGGNAKYLDYNQEIPGAGRMFLMNLSEEDLAMAQLAPLLKFPIAIVSTTIEFFLILYHVLAVKAPERMILIKNIGQRA